MKQDLFRVSRTQERIYTAQSMLSEGDPTYVFSTVITTEKPMTETMVQKAIGALIGRHESLRTSFHITGEGLFQKIYDAGDMAWIEDAVNRSRTKPGTDLLGLSWDLSKAPLFKWEYEGKSLTIHWHHIINDGTGASRFAYEFALIYNGGEPKEPELNPREYASWENEWINTSEYEESRRNWSGLFDGFEDIRELRLPADGVLNRSHLKKAGHLYIDISKELSEAANSLCTGLKVTPYVLFMSVFSVMLNKYTGQHRFILGTVMRGRMTEKTLPVLGMFVTTLPIPVRLDENESFAGIVGHVKDKVSFARDNQLTALEDIAADYGNNGGMERTRHDHLLFDVLFTKKDYVGSLPDIDGNAAKLTFIDEIMPMYDLTLQMGKVNGVYEFDFEYDQDLFDEACIREMGRHYVNLIASCISAPDKPVSEASMLDAAERKWLLDRGKGDRAVSDRTTVLERIGRQVLKNPGKTALLFSNEAFTYEELWNASSVLADMLLSIYAAGPADRPEHRVVLIADRGFGMIASILGILKSGAGYVPVSPEYPDDRILYMIKDSEPDCVLVFGTGLSESITGSLAEMGIAAVYADKHDLYGKSCSEKTPVIKPEQIAYMIYTSGTTGNPKGVVVEHRQLTALLNAYEDIYGLSEKDTVLQFANYVFDQSVWEIFHILTRGGTLCLASQEQIKDPELLEEYCERSSVTVMMITPGYLRLLNADGFPTLRLLDVGGEAPTRSLLKTWTKRGRRVFNTYGPTETTVNATTYKFSDNGAIPDGSGKGRDSVPIGKPAPDMEVYVMKENELCGIGVPGELCIGGPQVARGYHNREKLTKEKFISNPFGKGTLYRSGDLARMLPDGNIEFMTRIDDQVKIRGFRVEPGEIETVMRSLDMVGNAVVVLRNNDTGDKLLCGYYTCADGHDEASSGIIRKALEERLPSYMIPSILIQVKEFALTINGKIDRRNLPEGIDETIMTGEEDGFIPPSTKAEKDCIDSFEKILGIKRISVTDDFLAIGGDSIKAIRIVSLLREMGYKVDAPALLKSRTIRSLASHIVKEETLSYREYKEIVPTPVMRIFAGSKLANPAYYDQAAVLTIKGHADAAALEHSINSLIYCHGMLRMISDAEGNIRIREKNSISPFSLTVYKGPDKPDREEIMDKLNSSIDPAKGTVLGAALFTGGKRDRLFLTFHHYVIDEVSWGIIISDLNILYAHFLNDTGHDGRSLKGYEDDLRVLPAPSVSFGEWSGKLWKYRELDRFKPERAYWMKLHESYMAASEEMHKRLFAHLVTGTVKSTGGKSLSVCVDKEVTNTLLNLSHRRYNTRVDAILIAALVRAISFNDGAAPVVIQMESHGRGNIGKGIVCDRTVGWFTAVYPVVIRSCANIEEQIIEVKELLASVPNAGIGYGLLFDDLADAGGVVFNYLGSSENGSDELISRSDEYAGVQVDPRNIEPGTLSFNIRSTDRGMRIDCVYDDIYDEAGITDLLAGFMDALTGIAHKTAEDKRVYSPSDLCVNRLLNVEEWKHLTSLYPPEDIETVAELTPLQQGMLYRYISDPGSGAYLLQDRLTIRGQWDPDLFLIALRAVFIRYDALRIRFMYRELNEPVQIILREDHIQPEYAEVSGKSFDEIAEDDLRKGIDPAADTMLRVTFNKDSTGCEEKELLITTHHCIIDGWSFPILTDTLMNYYRMLLKGVKADDLIYKARRESIKECSYADYLRGRGTLGYVEKLKKWNEYLDDFDESTGIEGTGCSGEEGGKAGYEVLHIDAGLEARIRRYTEKYRITPGCFFGCVWGLLLGFENNVQDVVFGETVSGRDRNIDGLVNSVGMFINTVPVRIRWKDDEYVSDVFRGRQDDYYTMQDVTDTPLDKIMSESLPGSGLIRTLYVFENYPGSDLDNDDHDITLMHEEVDYPVSIGVGDENGFTVTLQFDGTKYDRRYAGLLLARYENIASQIVDGRNLKISQIERITADEKEYMLSDLAGVKGLIPKDTVLDMISRQVSAKPDSIAVAMGDDTLSYGRLWNASLNLAESIGYGKERFVGIYADRGLGMIVAMIAAFIAGAAYVPIDTAYPDERINFILNDSRSSVVIRSTDKGSDDRKGLFDKAGVKVIDVSVDMYDRREKRTAPFPDHGKLKNRLAYMIYTSGTTGEPKGVEIEHAALSQMIYSNIDYYGVFDNTVLQSASYVFDASVQEIFVTLASGGTVCLIPRNVLLNSAETGMYCRKMGVKVLTGTNALLQALVPSDFDNMKLVCMGGDAANAETFAAWSKHTEMLVNDYGPTEACVNATAHTYKAGEKDPIPIGRPYYNKKTYVMQGNKLCGRGQRGEICIGGTGLARGYHNRPELNSRVFKPNPFGEGRIYRTGDIGVFGLDGELRFTGRNDDQIKIRGYRIETGEIETCIRKYHNIKETVVISRKNGSREPYLAAYVVWNGSPETDALKAWLIKKLPSYMVPAAIVSIEKLPLLISGKIDKKALPEPERSTEHVPAEGYFEQMTAELFEKVLGVEGVGRNDSFFDLGGSSIDMMKLISGLSGYNVSISDILAAPTPALLGERLLNGWNGLESKGQGMILLKDGDVSQASMYCIPPSGGRSLCYLPLIRELGFAGRIYGLTDEKYSKFSEMTLEELEGLDPSEENMWDDTVSRYMDRIASGFKDGDILTGYSQGGTVAQLIAGRLEKHGIKVGRVIALEALPPGSDDTDTGEYLSRPERLRTSAALFIGGPVSDKSEPVDDHITDKDYLKKSLKKSMGDTAADEMLHLLYETYLVYSCNILNPLNTGDKINSRIDCIILSDTITDETGQYELLEKNPWEACSKGSGRAFAIRGSLDEHLIFLSKYRKLISDIVNKLLLQ